MKWIAAVLWVLAACDTSGGVLPGPLVPQWGPAPDLGAGPPSGVPEDQEQLFQTDSIQRIDLALPTASWEGLTVEPRTYVPGSVGWRTTWKGSVGVRIKGYLGSFRAVGGRSAWRVSFDHYLPGQRLDGLEGFALNNMVQDPSKLHEWLGYHLYRGMDVPAPRLNHAWLRVDGEPWGLYLVVETSDDPFIERWFTDDEGNLYDNQHPCEMVPGDAPCFEVDEVGLNTPREDLEALIEAVNAPPGPDWLPRRAERLDVRRFVAMMAVDAILGHWDGYMYNLNNFRIYCDTGGLCTFMPWGIDQTWNGGWSPFDTIGTLSQRCAQDAVCRGMIHRAMADAILLWREIPLTRWAEDRYDLIRPFLYADPRLEHSTLDFENAVSGLWDALETSDEELEAYLPAVP